MNGDTLITEEAKKQEEIAVKNAAEAFGSFMSTMDELSETQEALINETNRKLELEKIETIRNELAEKSR